jgi:hypothetical protein
MWSRAFTVVAKVTAVIFAGFTALIGRGFTGAVEPGAGRLDTVSWVVIGIALFAGLFFAPRAAHGGWASRTIVALAMVPATIVFGRSVIEFIGRGRQDWGLIAVFGAGLVVHLAAFVVLALGRGQSSEAKAFGRG